MPQPCTGEEDQTKSRTYIFFFALLLDASPFAFELGWAYSLISFLSTNLPRAAKLSYVALLVQCILSLLTLELLVYSHGV
jgi:hypothetical protein